MTKSNWEKTDNRFVAFFDILGFKDLVQKNPHERVLEKLESLKESINMLETMGDEDMLKEFELEKDQTRAVTFSDSIIIFSKGDGFKDAMKLIIDSYSILKIAIEKEIAIKGAVSFGNITVDFNKSLFFGQPIIDAYLLEEELQMLTVIADNNFDKKLASLKKHHWFDEIFVRYRANLKSGKISHNIMRPHLAKTISPRIKSITRLYELTSGKPRVYIDNTLDFLDSLPKK